MIEMTYRLVPQEFRKYAGMRFEIASQRQRAEHMAFTFSNECISGPDTPFGRMSRNGLLLCDQTRHYLYRWEFGKTALSYKRGTNLVLEAYIDSVITPGMTDGEKAVALSQSMHFDLIKQFPKVPVFLYGESDQETLLKGAGHCSCRGRLLSAMCQMIGIQARPAMQWTWRDPMHPDKLLGGHTVAEVLIDGHWGFFDPQHHLYCGDGKGRFFSIDEIRQEPGLFTKMPDGLVEKMAPVGYGSAQGEMNVFEYYWGKNFNPGCPTQISRHDVAWPYRGGWFWATAEVRQKQQHDVDRNLAVLHGLAAKGEITDAVYQMGLEDFRNAYGITDGGLPSRAGGDFTGSTIKG